MLRKVRSIKILIAIIPLGLAVLQGCLPVQGLLPTFTPTSAPLTVEPSATIIWFPATATGTAYPTGELIPTGEVIVDHGDLIIDDDFSTLTDWQQGVFPAGNIRQGDGYISLAVAKPQSNLTSFRTKTLLGDFYLETIAQPGLCSMDDSFGIIFNEVNDRNYYRLVLSCAGQFRVEQLKENRTRVVVDWQPSSQVPRGPQLPFKVGLWYGGGLIRVFIEDEFQTELRITPVSGGVGFFAKTISREALSIAFSELKIYQVGKENYPPTPTPTPTSTKNHIRLRQPRK